MALIERYVDPDATGSGTGADWTNAYTSLNAWEAAEQTDLVSDGDNHTVHLRSSSGGDDTTAVTVSGWTTDATHIITVTQDDFPSSGILDGTKYVLSGTNIRLVDINEEYVNIDKFQIVASTTGTTTYVMYFSVAAPSSINISKMIMKCDSATGGRAINGIRVNDADITVTVNNSTFYGFIGSIYGTGVRCDAGSLSCFNCTMYDNYLGMWRSGGTLVATNCAVGNNTDDFSGTITIDYCCSDDGDGTNAVAPNAGGWTDVFTDPANGDFSLKLGSNCIDAGTNTGAPSTDIIGTARPQNVTVDIGAYEYVETGIVIFRRRMECA